MTRRHMNFEMQRIWSELKVTTLLVTHSVDEALFLADRAIVLTGRPGRIAREVTVPFARPRRVDVSRSKDFHDMFDDLVDALDPPTAGNEQ